MDDEEILLPSQEIYEGICDNCGQEYITTNERDTTCQDCRLKEYMKYYNPQYRLRKKIMKLG